jgi:predicted GNAT family acetyltransferase
MRPAVVELRDPDDAYAQASDFLAARPTHHNVLLTVLGQSRELGIDGRFWLARDGARVVGFAIQSPPGMPVGLADMDDDTTRALAEAIDPHVPGVIGLARVTSTFAGHYAQWHRLPARPREGGRILELGTLRNIASAPGSPRLATIEDRPTLVAWALAFDADTARGPTAGPSMEMMQRVISRQQWWIWDDGGPTSMVRHSDTAAGTVRVQHVYTPPEHRGKGYASASVQHLSGELAGRGLRCMLYTQLENPTSNGIYLALGYEPVAEVLGYDFG